MDSLDELAETAKPESIFFASAGSLARAGSGGFSPALSLANSVFCGATAGDAAGRWSKATWIECRSGPASMRTITPTSNTPDTARVICGQNLTSSSKNDGEGDSGAAFDHCLAASAC